MRFSVSADLPPSLHIESQRDVEEYCAYLEHYEVPMGFDTETSGLEHDGLGVEVFVVCMATHDTRAAIILTEENTPRVMEMLERTQKWHCGFNIIYDWNAIYGHTRFRLGWDRPCDLQTCYADAMKLWCLYDEEGEETYGNRGLKARVRHYLGLPMNDFDRILIEGGITKAFETSYNLTLEYCTRDAFAHLGVTLLGKEIAEQYPWCARCPECGEYAFSKNPDGTWNCINHPRTHSEELLTMWDWHRELDVPYTKVLQDMQRVGTPVNWNYLESCREPLVRAQEQLLRQFNREVADALVERGGSPVEINPNSDRQLRTFFHGTEEGGKVVGLGLPAQGRTEGGEISIKDDGLRRLVVRHQAPAAMTLLKYKKTSKILSTYVDGIIKRRFDATGRLHGSFRAVTTTGRLRSRDPNMQNLPARPLEIELPPSSTPPELEDLLEMGLSEEEAIHELSQPCYQPSKRTVSIRDAVQAPDGWMLCCADYAQLELRIVAMEANCSAMIAAINDGMDLHCYAAARAYSAGLNGMAYEDIYETKQASDRDYGPRIAKLRAAIEAGSLENSMEIVQPRLVFLEKEDRVRLEKEWAALWPTLTHMDVLDPANESVSRAFSVLGAADKKLKNLRSAAKSAIFGIVYGIGPTKLAMQITEATGQVTTPDEAKPLIQSIKREIFPGIGEMEERQQFMVRKYGYVRTAMGRYRHPAGANSGNAAKRAQALRQCVNSPIQGCAADMVQRAMIAIHWDPEFRKLGGILINQVHDELLSMAPEENAKEVLARQQHLMETAHMIPSPVRFVTSGNIGKTWDEAK